jgi:ESS family glutamate:Na+ symporter
MIDRLADAQTVGLAMAILGVMFAVGWVVRSGIGFLRALFIPSSIVAGFLVLLLGPQVLGKLTHSHGLFPTEVLETWRVMPGLLINVVFGAIMVGKTLPKPRRLWHAAAPHALFGTFLSPGQFALAGLAVLFILGPVLGLPPEAAALLEMSFAGGHGTIAGMGQLLTDVGSPELVDVGLGLATISMIIGVVAGSALVRWAVHSPRVTVMRNVAPTRQDNYDLDRVRVVPADESRHTNDGIHPTVLAFAFIAAAIVLGVAILWGAIGTTSLASLGSNVPAIVIFTVIGVLWSVVTLLWLGRRFHRTNWFEHTIADFGQSQGNVATGFVLADMVDPQRRTSTANDYGYKQLIYEPILGGGLINGTVGPTHRRLRFTGFHRCEPDPLGCRRRLGDTPTAARDRVRESTIRTQNGIQSEAAHCLAPSRSSRSNTLISPGTIHASAWMAWMIHSLFVTTAMRLKAEW